MLSWLDCLCTFIDGSLQDWWEHLRQLQPKGRRRGLDSLFMLTIWALWKERNARLFERHERSFHELLEHTREEAQLWIEAGASRLGCLKRE